MSGMNIEIVEPMQINERIENWRNAQDAGFKLPCPRCGQGTVSSSAYKSLHADIRICVSCHFTEESCNENKYAKDVPLPLWYVNAGLYRGIGYTTYKDGYVLPVERAWYITNDDIDDICCGALEGGINYWCSACVVDGDYLGEFASDQISRGGTFKLFDTEEDKWYRLDKDHLLWGISRAIRDGYIKQALVPRNGTIDTGMCDAIVCDIIFQYALFGDIVYG